LRIELPSGAGAAPLRIDFVSALTTLEIASIHLADGSKTYFCADEPPQFDSIAIRGDAERLPDDQLLRLKITGIDPQLYLSRVETACAGRLFLEMRLRVT